MRKWLKSACPSLLCSRVRFPLAPDLSRVPPPEELEETAKELADEELERAAEEGDLAIPGV